MNLKLEALQYQQEAVEAVTNVFDGNVKNTFDNSTDEGIRFNLLVLKPEQIEDNIKNILTENGIDETKAQLSEDKDICVEMETGTGKTLVYLKTIYELHNRYGFTKFIILVPSIAIRQGVLGTLKTFEKQLNDIYGFTPKYFEYDSKKLNEVKSFADEQHPQIMVMTTAAIVGDDRVINRQEREGLFDNLAFIEVIAKTNPIVIMDEPQEGMDAPKTKEAIDKLNPLVKIRYSATHKEIKNLIYRLTPYDSYKQNLVKKIRLFTVTEKNDEATLKIELAEVQESASDPKVKLKAWKIVGGRHVLGETNWLKKGDNLGEKTGNSSYALYTIQDIQKPLLDRRWHVKFTNGAEIVQNQTSANIESIWALQLDWMIRCHFEKKKQLESKNIKCLSLVFIDRVANYMGDNPKIKNLFVEKYTELYPQYNEGTPTAEHVESVQGYYFAKTSGGDYTDNETSMLKNKEIFKLILEKKDELLSIENPVQFVFSHSALGVGWDNPNVFNIATLNNSNSLIRKRQEIGRGLRICVNQNGERVYDAPEAKDEERINQLTVFPNESSETFIETYQSEIREVYGTSDEGAVITVTHKGKPKNKVAFKLNKDDKVQNAFRKFWDKMAKETNYVVSFNEDTLVENCVEALKNISIARYMVEVSARTVDELTAEGTKETFLGSQDYELKARFTPLDLIEEISEHTQLSYPTIFRIARGITDKSEMIKNPPLFVHLAVNKIKQIELDEMLRGIEYKLTGESLPFEFADYEKEVADDKIAETPRRGIFDKMIVDSTTVEKPFAETADRKDEVVCFLKLPKYYSIKTPIGNYEPDFGVVLCRKSLIGNCEDEYYFVVETKGTNDLKDVKALKESEIYKIKCAMKHFEALGLKDFYQAPIKEYDYFSAEADKIIKR